MKQPVKDPVGHTIVGVVQYWGRHVCIHFTDNTYQLIEASCGNYPEDGDEPWCDFYTAKEAARWVRTNPSDAKKLGILTQEECEEAIRALEVERGSLMEGRDRREYLRLKAKFEKGAR